VRQQGGNFADEIAPLPTRKIVIDKATKEESGQDVLLANDEGEIFGEIRYDSNQWPAFAKRPGKHDRTDESYRYFA
jgi:hypothetical protein